MTPATASVIVGILGGFSPSENEAEIAIITAMLAKFTTTIASDPQKHQRLPPPMHLLKNTQW